MQITEVRIKLMEDSGERLCAFCSITLDDCFVIRDLKIIHGSKGPFVAMPSRKLTDRCPKCETKNYLRASFCNHCGVRLNPDRATKDEEGRAKLYADIAHPINSECRDDIQRCVIVAYQEELIKSRQEGYVCRYDDYGEDQFAALNEEPELVASEPNSTNKFPAFQTKAGKMLRIDGSQDQQADHSSERSQESPPATGNLEKFGDGII